MIFKTQNPKKGFLEEHSGVGHKFTSFRSTYYGKPRIAHHRSATKDALFGRKTWTEQNQQICLEMETDLRNPVKELEMGNDSSGFRWNLSESFWGRPDRETPRQVIGPFNYAWPATSLSLSLIPFSHFVSTHKLDSENSDLLLLQIALVVFGLGPDSGWCFCHY